MRKSNRTAAKTREIRCFHCTSDAIREHLPLLKMLLERRQYAEWLTLDEKYSAGLLGLAVGLEKYDPSLGIKLGYWLAYSIDKAIRTEERLLATQHKMTPTSLDEKTDDALDPVDPNGFDPVLDEERRTLDKIKRLIFDEIYRLPDRERRVVLGSYVDGKTQRAIAKEEGVAQSWICRLQKSALAKVKREVARRLREEEDASND